jgi:hypothetical protein
VSLETLGQPRTAVGINPNIYPIPYIRLVWKQDVVPGVPPPLLFDYRTTWLPGVLSVPTRFLHTADAWVIQGNGDYTIGAVSVDNEIPGLIGAVLQDLTDIGATFGAVHYPGVYVRELAKFPGANLNSADMAPLVNINLQIDSWERNVPFPGSPNPIPDNPPFDPPQNPFIDPNAVFDGGGGWPTLPDGDVGRRVEQRGVAHALFFFGGREIVAKTMQGHDREMLTTTKKVLTNIIARDARVGNPKPTRKLSNRILMFPATGSPTLQSSLNAVLAQVNALLALTK